MKSTTATKKRRKVKVAEEVVTKSKKNMDFILFLLILTTLFIGLIMLFSASYVDGFFAKDDSFFYIRKQLIFAAVGLVAMLIFVFIDYNFWKHLNRVIYAVAIIFLVMAFVIPTRSDHKRWINIGPIGFQPSEIAKFAVIVMCAYLIDQYGEKNMATFQYGVFNIAVRIAPILAMILFARHVSATILIGLMVAIMMLVGGTRLRWLILALIIIIPIIYLLLQLEMFDYAHDRIALWQNPLAETKTPADGYQIRQSLYAISSGGFTGLGIGNSRQKFMYLPELQNDYIFAVICEELGFIGAIGIIILFLLLIFRGYFIAIRAKDTFGKVMAVGITTQIAVQTFLNIAVATNALPSTGIALPFFSYGGTSLMLLLGEMGILLSISRTADLSVRSKKNQDEIVKEVVE